MKKASFFFILFCYAASFESIQFERIYRRRRRLQQQLLTSHQTLVSSSSSSLYTRDRIFTRIIIIIFPSSSSSLYASTHFWFRKEIYSFIQPLMIMLIMNIIWFLNYNNNNDNKCDEEKKCDVKPLFFFVSVVNYGFFFCWKKN